MKRERAENFRLFLNRVRSDNRTRSEVKNDYRTTFVASCFMCFVSLILSILNFAKGYYTMMYSTLALVVGFAISAICSSAIKKRVISIILMSLMVGFIFSLYAINGENEGFAILWILLVPALSMSFVGLETGFAISLYFQLFLIVICYTPVRNYINTEYYTQTFLFRFPILFFTDFAASAFLSFQKQYYYKKSERLALTDGLTGLGNRTLYNETADEINEVNKNNLTVISIDINRLKYINDTYGHKFGDHLIVKVSTTMLDSFKNARALCRVGGDEFVVITYLSIEELTKQLEDFKKSIDSKNGPGAEACSVSVGYARFDSGNKMRVEELLAVADKIMYNNKNIFYQDSNIDRRKS